MNDEDSIVLGSKITKLTDNYLHKKQNLLNHANPNN